jgi:hypothetical protein
MAFIEAQNVDGADRVANMLKLIARCIVNEAGERIGRVDDIQRLGKKSPLTLVKLKDACMRINGVQAKTETVRKNDSSEAASSASPTGTATSEE